MHLFRKLSTIGLIGACTCLLTHVSHAQTLYYDTNNVDSVLTPGVGTWGTTSAIWNTSNTGAAGTLTAWDNLNPALASFLTGGSNALTLTENLSLRGIHQSNAGTLTSIDGAYQLNFIQALGQTAFRNDSQGTFTFNANTEIRLDDTTSTYESEWFTGTGSRTIIHGSVTSALGSEVNSTYNGGWLIRGPGDLELNGNNSISGIVKLESTVTIGHDGALGSTALIVIKDGVLKWKTGTTTDFSSRIRTEAGSTATFDTNGQNITFETGLTGAGQLIKRGAGTLILGKEGTHNGGIIVAEGILQNGASGAAQSNAFGATDNKIIVRNGASLDLASSSSDNYNAPSKRYLLEVEGKGVADTSNSVYGGYLGAVFNSGSSGSTNPSFSDIKLTGDTSFAGRKVTTGGRWGIDNIDAQGYKITVVNGNGLSWKANSSTQAKNVRDIAIEQGKMYMDGSYLGDANYTLSINGHANVGSTAARGDFGNWVANRTVNKKIELNGGRIFFEGVNTVTTPGGAKNSYTSSTWTFNGEVTLRTGNSGNYSNLFESAFSVRDYKMTQKLTGQGGFQYQGATADLETWTAGATSSTQLKRWSIFYLLHGNNDFTGDITLTRGVIRMSDGTANGALTAGTNRLHFNTSGNTAVFDLFGTNQTLGALDGASSTSHFIQNNKSNTTATLTIGGGNTSGTYAGYLLDHKALGQNNELLSTEGSTNAKLALVKIGTGKQVLTNNSTFSGSTTISGGELQLGATSSLLSSSARLGTGAVTVNLGGTLSGNGTVGSATGMTLVNTGANLKVGHDTSTAQQSLTIDGAFTNHGTMLFDLFTYTAGAGANNHSDFVKFNLNTSINLQGAIQLSNLSGTASETWTEGTWFRIIDWNTVEMSNRNVSGLSLGMMPTLANGLEWRLDQLSTLGMLYIAVPEPSRTLLLSSALTLLFTRRKRMKA